MFGRGKLQPVLADARNTVENVAEIVKNGLHTLVSLAVGILAVSLLTLAAVLSRV